MLSDQDKARILDEETYRREVRAGLEMLDSKGSRRKKLWGIVNSAIGIWFLSSVVIGIFGFVYNNWYLIKRENQRAAQRLDAEIASRLVYFNVLLMQREGASQAERTGDYYDLSALVAPLEQPSAVSFPVNVFPEYSNRSLRSLLWELRQVSPDNEQKDLTVAYKESLQLQVIYLNATYAQKRVPDQGIPGPGMISAPQARALRESFLGIRHVCCVFNLQRWGSPFDGLLKKEDWCTESQK